MSNVASKHDLNPRPPYDFYVIDIIELEDNDEEYKPIQYVNHWTFKDLDSAQIAFDKLKEWGKTSFPEAYNETPTMISSSMFDYYDTPLRRGILYGEYFADKDEDFDY